MLVIKRNGEREVFDEAKIAKAMRGTFRELEQEIEELLLYEMALEIKAAYKEADLKEVEVESIQDDVELMLMQRGYYNPARAFIKYRENKAIARRNPWEDNDERQDLILQKYLIEGETKKDFIERIAFGNTRLEKIFRNREGIWGGRILYAVGREGNITGSNCYVAKDPEDSLLDIYRADYHIARTYSYGGGQGMNLSNLRPKGAKVNNSSNTTPGVMTFAEKYSHTTLNTQQESRRGALMLVLNIDHPDVIDFITAKLDLTKIEGANISLAITDEFMKAWINDEDWEMSFETRHEIIKKTAKARDLMELVSYAAHTMGDPGVIFIDNINNYHLLSEYDEVKFTATNPCGEQPLMANGSCNLGSVNLNAFVRNPFKNNAYFDYNRFREVVKEMVWGLDDLLDMFGDRHALQEQIDHVREWREVGLGVMGLADFALSMKKGYGTGPFLKELDKVMRTMANTAAQASALRARDKGVFPKYDYEKISNSEFFKTVYDEETVDLIEKYGLRNSRLLSIAPTGSISNIIGVSGGVEPYFMLSYNRTIKSMFEQERIIEVVEKTPKKLMEELKIKHTSELPNWAQTTSQNISFEDRSKVQSLIQKYVDTAISSTFNLPNKATTKDIKNIYKTAWQKNLKGATVFRDNCKKIGILTGSKKHKDNNPAAKPTIKIFEKWVDKATNEVKEYVNVITIEEESLQSEKIQTEMCPLCGEHLEKRQGCTKCSNPECYFEKCSI